MSASNTPVSHPGEILAEPAIEGETESRLAFTAEAIELLDMLWRKHGPLMFHQSGGCCDGSSPMCFPLGDLKTGAADVQLGTIDIDSGTEGSATRASTPAAESPDSPESRRIPFFMSAEQFEYWKHTFLTIDVVPGRGSGFSVEAPEGKRFLVRSRLMEA